ncbi:ParB N-terminal domain-containing protein [Vibrio campbellii]|uniref:ParB N-terminal domain-containing protein n=1 Tax=Vibrio campbellii TaxID=680 RepID=UPI00249C4003|nr:ParB N-terminal domain-containing protein [Vibrio campbellii]
MNSNFELVDIDTIIEGERFRQEHDVDADMNLWMSIQSDGLMQPLGIDELNTLIWGGRRLRALRHLHSMANREGHLGDPDEFRLVPVIRIDLAQRAENALEFSDVGSLHQVDPAAARELIKVKLEQQENELRREFTDSEKYAIASRVEQLQTMTNKTNNIEAKTDYVMRNEVRRHIEAGRTQAEIVKDCGVSSATVPKVRKAMKEGDDGFFDGSAVSYVICRENNVGNRANHSGTKAGEAVGMSRSSCDYLKKTQEQGSPELIQARDSEQVSRKAASHIAELPQEQQATIDFTNRTEVKEAQLQGQAIIQQRKDAGEEARGRKKVTLVQVTVKHTWVDADAYEEKLALMQQEAERIGNELVKADPSFSSQLHNTLGGLI